MASTFCAFFHIRRGSRRHMRNGMYPAFPHYGWEGAVPGIRGSRRALRYPSTHGQWLSRGLSSPSQRMGPASSPLTPDGSPTSGPVRGRRWHKVRAPAAPPLSLPGMAPAQAMALPVTHLPCRSPGNAPATRPPPPRWDDRNLAAHRHPRTAHKMKEARHLTGLPLLSGSKGGI